MQCSNTVKQPKTAWRWPVEAWVTLKACLFHHYTLWGPEPQNHHAWGVVDIKLPADCGPGMMHAYRSITPYNVQYFVVYFFPRGFPWSTVTDRCWDNMTIIDETSLCANNVSIITGVCVFYKSLIDFLYLVVLYQEFYYSTTRPYQNTEMTLDSAASHIKVTCPLRDRSFCHGKV